MFVTHLSMMLLMRLQCWCEVLMWLLPAEVTPGAASWLLSLMWDVVTDVGCCHWCRLKVVGWLISPLKFSSNVYYCYWLPSAFDWSVHLTVPLIDQMVCQLSSWWVLQQSSELQLNSHVIDFDNSLIFLKVTDWLWSLRSIVLTNPPFEWVY